MLVHTKPAGSPAAGLAADQRAGACVTRPARRTPGPGVDEIVHEGGHRWPPPLYRTSGGMYSPLAGRPHPGRLQAVVPADPAPRPAANTPIDPARAWLPTRRACTPAAFALACLRSRRSRSRTSPVLGHDRGSSRRRIPAVADVPYQRRCRVQRSGPGRIRQGPSMYEMEGPCPASPHRLASCPAVPTPRAARRGQVPARETGLPAPPTFPGSPPGGARFRTVRTFLLPQRAPRKSPLPAISGFPAIHEPIHRKRVVIRIRRRLSTGLFTAYPQAPGCSRRTLDPLSPNAIG